MASIVKQYRIVKSGARNFVIILSGVPGEFAIRAACFPSLSQSKRACDPLVLAERQIDLLGNSRAAVSGTALLYLYDGVDDLLTWSLRPRLHAATRRIE